MAKRGAKKFDELTQADAESLYANLEKLAEQQRPSDATVSAPSHGPISEALVTEIKNLVKQAEQLRPARLNVRKSGW